jgi:predicted ArsR family transcriptional regulator
VDDDLADLDAVAALTEPVRRALYDAVARSAVPMGRDAAAAAVGISRGLAAFHLDRLVELGLLDASYRRLSGRSGPGAGRPAKLYERAAGEHAVSVPPRSYDLAAQLLAEAVEASRPARAALHAAARRTGRALTSAPASLAGVVDALRRQGFEPRVEDDRVVLANCPFHAIAAAHTELVCGANLALVEGLVEGLAGEATARLEPDPARCCVVLHTKSSSS